MPGVEVRIKVKSTNIYGTVHNISGQEDPVCFLVFLFKRGPSIDRSGVRRAVMVYV